MKLNITREQKDALVEYLKASEDCEKLSENEWIMDIYDIDTPASLDLVFKKDSVFADGAEFLKYDEEMDGWYISGPIADAESVVAVMKTVGAIK